MARLVNDWKEPVTLKRPGAGNYNSEGHWVPGSNLNTTIHVNVQNTKPEEVQLLPEGFRSKASITIYSDVPLYGVDVDTAKASDMITWEGEDYDVIMVQHYKKMFVYWKAWAVRKEKENDVG